MEEYYGEHTKGCQCSSCLEGRVEEYKCEHCGTVCADDDELTIFHRGCRLAAAFPGAYRDEGGLRIFDMAKVKEQMGIPDDIASDAPKEDIEDKIDSKLAKTRGPFREDEEDI